MNENVVDDASQIDDVKHLEKLLTRFQQMKLYLEPRGTRIKMLFARKSASKWTPIKRQKMLRRSSGVSKDLDSVENAITMCSMRLVALTAAKTENA